MGPVARRDLDVVYPLGPESVHLMRGCGLKIVFLDAGSDGLGNPVESSVDDRRAMLEAHDFIFILDRPGVLHDALTIGDVIAAFEKRQHDLRLDDVDADPNLLLIHLVVVEDHVEVFEKSLVALPCHRQRAMHRAVCREGRVFDPRTVEFLRSDFGAEAEDVRIAVTRDDRVAAHVIDLG